MKGDRRATDDYNEVLYTVTYFSYVENKLKNKDILSIMTKSIRLVKTIICVFPYDLREKSKQTFWPTQCNLQPSHVMLYT